MNRKIKFRTWDRIQSQFYYNYRIGKIHTGENFIELNEVFNFQSDNLVFQQFTGLKDKNGKEIFEGDIIKFEEFDPWEVFYAGSCFCIYEPSVLGVSPIDAWELNKCEVIGNVFENPDLLTP